MKKIIQLIKNYKWRSFIKEHPGYREYVKPYLSPVDLIAKMKNDGLTIPQSDLSAKIIFRNNYYRFKAYFIPFHDKSNLFPAGTYFSQIYSLYLADQKIRDFLFPLISVLEVRVRGVLDNVVTSQTKNPFWHLDATNFSNFGNVERVLKKAGSRFTSSPHEYAKHYVSHYFNRQSFDYKQIPPFWILSEILTLEHLATFAKHIDEKKFRRKGGSFLDDCANEFGLTSHGALVTNILCMLELRNICAHHSRIWNRNLRAPQGISKKITIKIPTLAPKINRLYQHLVMLRIMCKSQGIEDGIKEFFVALITSQPIFQRDRVAMGFPVGWEHDAVWK
ncbi:Abi family protein [Herbaspirillum sp. C9C3]|uniref:Abi family protein n=1 Tax=Herbaspirillum sp. C9C3 TaxID=2735271 RepID=UPI00158544CB|nr:Abi family protein [Herbaspirillum sp. C9C3]NUT61445.1 Abi family protein [Herbaspirillum sp. C9C3]